MYKYQTARHICAGFTVSCLWLLPLSTTQTQILTVGMVCAVAMLVGLNATIPRSIFYALLAGALLATALPVVYTNDKLSFLAWLFVAWISCKLGAALRTNRSALAYFMVAVFASSNVNALEGLLQYFGLADALHPWVPDALQRGVAVGALRQRNLLATFLCCGIICTIGLVLIKKISTSLGWLSVLILGFGIAATNSRIGTLGVICLAVAALVARKKVDPRVPRYFWGAVVVIFFASFALPKIAIWHGFDVAVLSEKFSNSGSDVRLSLWGNVMDMILVHPWTGWGWNELKYAHYMTLFEDDKVSFGGLLGNAHNLILHIAVTLGIPMATIFTGLVGWGGYTAFRSCAQASKDASPQAPDLTYSALALLLVIGLHSLVEFPLWHAGFMSLTWTAIGYLCPTPSIKPSALPARDSISLAYCAAACVVAACFFVWHQYTVVLKTTAVPFGMVEAQRRALAEASGAWFFQDQLDIMDLSLNKTNAFNAKASRERAEKLLHYSPTPVVIESLLTSLIYLSDGPAIRFHALRYCKAVPVEYHRWLNENVNAIASFQAGLDTSCTPAMPTPPR